MKQHLLACALSLSALSLAADEQWMTKRVHDHLVIQDYPSALDEALWAITQYPESKSLYQALILVYAKMGDEKKMLSAWEKYAALAPDDTLNQDLIEGMAWGVIQKGTESSALSTRVIGLIAAFLCQDSKGVQLLHKNMSDPNSLIRGLSVKLSSNCLDDKLRDQVWRLFLIEKNFNVRLEIIQALGKMKISESQASLEAIIADDKNLDEEKAAALQSLVNLLDEGDRAYVERLAKSGRAGLRLLACQIVDHFDLKQDIDLIIPLLDDKRAEVRAAALYSLGLLRLSTYDGKPSADLFQAKMLDADPHVAITACWGLTLQQPEQGMNAFKKWFKHENKDVRLTAAAALVATGKYGSSLVQHMFYETADTYVRLNLALGLISQRTDVKNACDALYAGLTQEKERWMMLDDGPFSALSKSTLKHQESIPQYPEAVNQSVRMEILNTLAILKYDKAQEAMKSFLKQQRNEGVTGMTVAMMLTEGDEDALTLVKELLQDEDRKVRFQAALILAMWGREEGIINFLEDSYGSAGREEKEKILEGLGNIGSRGSIPFFLEALKEPFQTLRLIAAFGLIKCINH